MPNKQTAEDEKLLTRLANTWHTYRSGNPGFCWKNGRSAYMSTALYGGLQNNPNWASGASDRELMGAWQSITASHHWKPELFDSWDEGSLASGRTNLQKAQNCKKAASISRRATGKADNVSAVDAAKAEAPPPPPAPPMSWPAVHTARHLPPPPATAPADAPTCTPPLALHPHTATPTPQGYKSPLPESS